MRINLSPAVSFECDEVIQFDSKDCPFKSCTDVPVDPLLHPGGFLRWDERLVIPVIVAMTTEQSHHGAAITTVYIQFQNKIQPHQY